MNNSICAEETTLIYAKADTEHKRRAIENANKYSPLASKLNSSRFKVSDDEMVKKLYGLKWYPLIFNSNFFAAASGEMPPHQFLSDFLIRIHWHEPFVFTPSIPFSN